MMNWLYSLLAHSRGQYATDSRPIAHAIALIDAHGR
jgi:hypothetical protein